MRLKKVWISNYKNLKDFKLDLDGKSFLDIFVGKNGSGKSNLLEAFVEIFNFLYEGNEDSIFPFDFELQMELASDNISIKHTSGKIIVNGRELKTIPAGSLPDKVILYYSGHNGTVASIADKYESSFKGKIKRASLEDSPSIISIGSKYKEILLAILLLQEDESKTKQYIKEKLRIVDIGSYLKIVFKKPYFSKKDIEIDEGDERFWGAEGITKNFIERMLKCSHVDTSGKARTEGFIFSEQKYTFYFDLVKIRKEFTDYSLLEFFVQFDNLKTLEMLESVNIPITLDYQNEASISYFSDGQFQSVYIYAIAEIFKDQNCLTLLDEPDAFLHPEWQFTFISQVNDIAENTAKSNHLMMSSHSASTVAKAEESTIRLFEFDGKAVKTSQVSKGEVIKSLSAGFISFSESEAQLSINHVLKNTTGPILFVEGITDEIILEIAWKKLYPTKKRNFVIQNAFDRSFLRNLFSREELKKNFPSRKMFALFDFDEAFNDWNGLKGNDLVTDAHKGLTKKLSYQEHFAMLLPVPDCPQIKGQVLDEANIPWGGTSCHLSMELLFYSDDLLDKPFKKVSVSGGGEIIQFPDSEKVNFAKDIVPLFPIEKFVIFKPIFEFITTTAGIN